MYEKEIAECIKWSRKRIGLTQGQLAERVGVSENMIGMYERCIESPGRDMLFLLAETLGFSVDELIANASAFGTYALPIEIADMLSDLDASQRKIVLATVKTLCDELKGDKM